MINCGRVCLRVDGEPPCPQCGAHRGDDPQACALCPGGDCQQDYEYIPHLEGCIPGRDPNQPDWLNDLIKATYDFAADVGGYRYGGLRR